MANKLSYAVVPGGLAADDHQQIFELAERGWTPSRIARRLQKHPATVYWFMLTKALVAPKRQNHKSYQRGGRTVRPFSPDEDVFITALRVQEFSFQSIADAVNKRFATERSAHGIHVRLVMLAAKEEAA
jgi:hypothetical protein